MCGKGQVINMIGDMLCENVSIQLEMKITTLASYPSTILIRDLFT